VAATFKGYEILMGNPVAIFDFVSKFSITLRDEFDEKKPPLLEIENMIKLNYSYSLTELNLVNKHVLFKVLMKMTKKG